MSDETVIRPSQLIHRVEDWLFGYDFFVSYRWSDGRVYAEALAHALGNTYSCFLDSDEYTAGDDVIASGNRALRQTGRLILVATPEIADSAHVKRELRIYRDSGKRIVAIDFDGSVAALRSANPNLASLLTDSELYIKEDAGRTPSDSPSERIIQEIARSLSVELKRFRRRRAIAAMFSALLTCVLILALLGSFAYQLVEYRAARRQLLTAFSARVRGVEQGQLDVTIDSATKNDTSQIVDLRSLVSACNKVGSVHSLNLLNCTLVSTRELAELAELERLNLYRCKGVDSLKFLESMPKLKKLQLDQTHLSDAILGSVAMPESLQEVKLSNNPGLTSAGVSTALRLPNLEHLSLFGCEGIVLSENDLEQLVKRAKDLQSESRLIFVDLSKTDHSIIKTRGDLLSEIDTIRRSGHTVLGLDTVANSH